MKTSIQNLVLALIFLSSCSVYDLTNLPPADVNEIYQNALADAVYPTDAKVDKNLFAISKDNPDLTWKTINGEEYVLVVSWKGEEKWYKPPNVGPDNVYNTGTSHPVWVTAAPQLLNWAKQETRLMKWVEDGAIEQVNSRLKQLLGLPPNPGNPYNYFVEFWVNPSDLFRPCPDREIDDNECEACNATDTTFQTWINDTRNARYYDTCELLDRYPWTALGYTYDWSPANKTHRGMSEYVIHNNANIIVNKIYTTEAYLKQQ
ncbi:MAG: hypothetical protein R8G66_03830 [Cytophagales bacterium]|nr:hypothetical protein [Cytophagales bacterium]